MLVDANTKLAKLKARIDLLLLKKNLVPSREKAHSLILSGVVKANGVIVKKCGELFSEDAEIEIVKDTCPYVGRGGLKLEGALKELEIDVKGKRCLDIGASTGGFTDCLLLNGASKVVAIDVGRNLLHEKIRNDERVTLIENLNARYLKNEDLPFEIDFVVIDVSFISVKIILKRIKEIIPKAPVLALIKPQFEAGRKNVIKGVVKDEKIKKEVIENIKNFALSIGYKIIATAKSQIKGAKGNEEFFIYLKGGEDEAI